MGGEFARDTLSPARRMSDDYDPPTGPLRVLQADHQLLFVDKPAGLLSVPGKGPELSDCLLRRVQRVYPEALLVHRLDRDTSGVMVFGLTAHAQRHLGLQFETRRVRKIYIARVIGEIEADSGIVDLPLAVDWPNRPRQRIDEVSGRAAVTSWRVIRRGREETRLRLEPRTGRSHQLRVHMLALGHPILGDPLYSEGWETQERMMLHAEELRLRHPDGGAGVRVRARAPF